MSPRKAKARITEITTENSDEITLCLIGEALLNDMQMY